MNRTVCSFAIAASVVLLASCAPQGRFTWGTYENSLYAYAKSPDQRATYKKSLEEAIAAGRLKNNVAPGLLAELGYLYMEDGDMTQAISLFEEEMTRYPESRVFLDGIIQRSRRANTTNEAVGPST
jgi:hypothetical protein